MKIDLYTQAGEKKNQIDLNPKIFGLEVNEHLIHSALIRQLSNARRPIAFAKTRAMVRGGGRKPWKQKGTGRARQGSIRSPHWRGGGIIFGPTGEENYNKSMPKKQRRAALFSLLSAKAKDASIIALEDYQSEKPKTKDLDILLKKLPINRNVLIVMPEKNDALRKSTHNLSYAKAITVGYLNPADLMKYRTVLFLQAALKKAESHFLK